MQRNSNFGSELQTFILLIISPNEMGLYGSTFFNTKSLENVHEHK